MRSDGKIAPGKSMTLICWADDSREPSKVGEAFVDLTKSLTKGEDDSKYIYLIYLVRHLNMLFEKFGFPSV